MNILGFPIVNHDASVCKIVDDKIIENYEIERQVRIKHLNYNTNLNSRKPFDNNEVLSTLKNSIGDFNPDLIATSSVIHRGYFRGIWKPIVKNYFVDDINIDLLYQKFVNHDYSNFNDYSLFLNDKLYYIDHHQAHASYSYFTSEFEDADILSYDGYGFRSQSIFCQNANNIIRTGVGNGPNCIFYIGLLWVFGNILFFNAKNSPGVGMALSQYGKVDDELIKVFEKIKNLFSSGIQTSYLFGFGKDSHGRHLYEYLTRNNTNRLINYGQSNFKEVKYPVEDFYATLQQYSIDIVLEGIPKFKSSDNLCLSGGCALNGYINEEILKRKLYKRIHVPPAVTDEGQGMGAALHALYNLEGKRIDVKNPKNIIYLGGKYNISDNLKSNIKLEDDELFPLIAKKISEGYVIGWYQGNSECGPRALGNRSILADPRNPKMKDHINFKIKKRQWYRPFAPSILKEEAPKWLVMNNNKESPYMTRILKYKKGKSKLVPATSHIDETARIQTVTEDSNPRYYKLIKEFYNITNIPILLNTSFNGKNEPIVEKPRDALRCFHKNNIDILVMDNYVYYRNNDENVKPFIEES